jgi:hypothetical protein
MSDATLAPYGNGCSPVHSLVTVSHSLARPILFAVIAETLGYGSSFVFVSLSAMVVTLLLIFYVPETRGRG